MKFSITATDQAGNPLAAATTVTVATAARGPEGPAGPAGATGPQGPQGDPGDSRVPDPAAEVDGRILVTLAGELVYDDPAAAGSSAAEDVTFTPAGTVAASDVQAAIEELDAEKSATSHNHAGVYDPAGTAAAAVAAHEADTTSVHGIADTANLIVEGDSRLTDARTPTAHATSHQDGGADELALDGSQITTGTVADARIAATIARDSEVTAAIAAHEADTTSVHGIADTSVLVTTSTVAELARDAVGAALVEGSGIDITVDDAGDTITIAATGGGSTFTKVRVQQSAAQSIGTGSFTVVTGWTENEDSAGAWASNAFTAPTTGDYIVTARLWWASNVTGTRWVRLTRNGTAIDGAARNTQTVTASGNGTGIPLAATVALTAGDVLRLEAFQDSGGNLSTLVSSPYITSLEIVGVGV